MNLYAYVGGNPVNLVDPEGLAADVIRAVPRPLPSPITLPRAISIGAGAAVSDGPSPIGDIVGAVIIVGAIINECIEDEDKCEKQLARDNATCAAISNAEHIGRRPRGAGQRCYSSAMQRYGNCLAGRPLGPLDTWNN